MRLWTGSLLVMLGLIVCGLALWLIIYHPSIELGLAGTLLMFMGGMGLGSGAYLVTHPEPPRSYYGD